MGGPNNMQLPSVGPGLPIDIPVRICTPEAAGTHYANWSVMNISQLQSFRARDLTINLCLVCGTGDSDMLEAISEIRSG